MSISVQLAQGIAQIVAQNIFLIVNWYPFKGDGSWGNLKAKIYERIAQKAHCGQQRKVRP